MSTTVTVISVGIGEKFHRHAIADITAEVDAWEQRFSRFRTESMLSRVNAAGRWTPVDQIYLDLLETARNAVLATEGRFNPAILGALVAHGYDRTVEEVQQGTHANRPMLTSVSSLDDWQHIEIDQVGMRARLPMDLRIDFGGIAKGALADHLAGRFQHWPGGAFSIGGDMRIWGSPPDGHVWRVGIENPLDSQRDIAIVELSDDGCTAIATSSRTKRAWRTNHGDAHHLIDPSTGAPAMSSLLAVSACASTAVAAEIVTKNLMVASAHGPLATNLLLDARWALTVSDTLDLTRITKEAA